MSKQDQAAKIIRFGAARGYTPEQTATLLNELNLLAPDLPKPKHDSDGAMTWSDGEIWVEDYEVEIYTDFPKSIGWMSVSRARGIAYALLAAANYSEEA